MTCEMRTERIYQNYHSIAFVVYISHQRITFLQPIIDQIIEVNCPSELKKMELMIDHTILYCTVLHFDDNT